MCVCPPLHTLYLNLGCYPIGSGQVQLQLPTPTWVFYDNFLLITAPLCPCLPVLSEQVGSDMLVDHTKFDMFVVQTTGDVWLAILYMWMELRRENWATSVHPRVIDIWVVMKAMSGWDNSVKMCRIRAKWKAALIKLECAHRSPGNLVKIQIWFRSSKVRPKILNIHLASRCYCSTDYTWKTSEVDDCNLRSNNI